jgi:mono/diheme cytochrome c family protein
VDAGDFCCIYAGDQERLQDNFIARAFALLGFDAVNVGDNEILYGLGSLGATAPPLPLTSANVTAAPAGVIAPYRRFDVGGVRVGVVGFVDEGLLPAEAAAVEVAEARPALAAAVEELAADADVIVCLAHVKDLDHARAFAASCPAAVDVIVAAHRGAATPQAEHIRGRWLVYTRPWNRYVGVLQLDVDRRGRVVKAANSYLPLTRETAPDEEMSALVAAYRNALLALVQAGGILRPPTAATPSGNAYVGIETCTSCHAGVAASWRATAHARAYDDLRRNGRTFDPHCVGCHVTGYGFKGGFDPTAPVPALAAVGCEECHGPGGGHAAGAAVETPSPAEDTCRRCHTPERNPDFDYGAYRARITH